VPLDPEQIKVLFSKQRQRGQYIKQMAELIGVTELELRERMAREALLRMSEQAKLPRRARLSREERIEEVLLRRYNVPPQLLQAYKREVEPDYGW
jgi:hypothetical protein